MAKSKIIAVILSIFAITILVVFAWSSLYTPNQTRIQQYSLQNIDPNPYISDVSVKLYFANEESVVWERRRVPNSDRLEETLIRELIAGPKDQNLRPTIPKEVNLISIDVLDKIAFVNFSREIQTKHPGGSFGELTTIASIVHTLTELERIDQVQLLVEGKKLETLLGHVYIYDPLAKEDVQ